MHVNYKQSKVSYSNNILLFWNSTDYNNTYELNIEFSPDYEQDMTRLASESFSFFLVC